MVAAQTARDFNAQSLEAEQKKYKLGASTTALVLAQERTLATGEDNLISATAAFAKDRSALQQILSNTLDLYGISLVDARRRCRQPASAHSRAHRAQGTRSTQAADLHATLRCRSRLEA